MLEIYINLLPVFAWFFLGVALRFFGWVDESHGAKLLKCMFFVTLPVMIFVKISEADLGWEKVYLPIINISINMVCLGLMLLLTRRLDIPRPVLGVVLVGSMITNNFFTFPFIYAVLGNEGLADAIIFDLGNAITGLTVAYIIAFKHGPEELKLKNILLNVGKLPAMWALGLAFVLNVKEIPIPANALLILEPFGLLTNPFILISLGIYFNMRMSHPGLTFLTVAVRMLMGFIVALFCVHLFDIEGMAAIVVILCGAAPIGFNALTYSSLAKLDMAFASSTVSTSILIGLFTIPFLLYILQSFFAI